RQSLLALLTMVVACGWWVAAVELFPSASRPYIGGSQNNDLLSLIFGYNGFGRLTGNESGSVGGFGALGSRWGLTGWDRLFNAQFGGQISWLIPAAIIFLGVALLLTWRRPRTDIVRAAFLPWGGVLLLTGAVFSFAQGIIHPYYTVALAPAIGALVGMGAVFLWARRSEQIARLALAGSLAITAGWSFILLGRSPAFFPDLRLGVLVLGLLGASQPSADLVALLTANASRYTWVAATIDANNAAGYQLATGDPVMAIGGFNGTDPAPTLAQFQQYVRDGKIHYFIAGGRGPGSGSASSSASSNAAQIAAWVQQNFAATSVGGVTVYDLTTTVTS